MFKSVFDWVEKLINEHGSSAIKNERLALKDEQIATLEKQLSEWKTAAEAAKAVARIFETENGRLRVEIQRKHDEMDAILHSSPPTSNLHFDPRKVPH
jgi:molecular chaperone GrpE (heat shock protein)